MDKVKNKENENEIEIETDLPEGFKMTELGPLPDEWRIVKINDIFKIQQGKSLSQEHRAKKPLFPFLRTANVLWGRLDLSVIDKMNFTEEEIQRLRLLPGDLLVCEGGDIGRTAIWQGELQLCFYQNHLHRLRAKYEEVEPEFYMYWMQAAVLLFGLYLGQGNKTTIPNLSKSRLGSFKVPFPSLSEQRTIAYLLHTVRKAKEATERVIQATRDMRKSLMRYLFTYGPVSVKKAESVSLKETDIGLVPEHWDVVKLGDVAKTASGGTPSRKNPEYFGGKIHWVKSGELNDSLVSCTEETLTEMGIINSNARVFPKGTLLIAMYGATAGKVGILECEAASNQAVCAVFPQKILSSNFLFYVFMYRRSKLLSERYGGAQPNISQTVIKAFNIPLPPLHEQHEIVRILQAVDKKLQAEEARNQALESLFKTLLHNLMTGKIRVKDFNLFNRKEVI